MDAAEDIAELRRLIENHRKYTGSSVASDILQDFDAHLANFHKVMPNDYKRVLMELAAG